MAPLSDNDRAEIEALAQRDAGEHCKGPLLALVTEVRRLRKLVLEGASAGSERDQEAADAEGL